MKLWLDEQREPDVSWVWAKTAHSAIVLLGGGCVERISFPPDQWDVIGEVTDWMIENENGARRGIHRTYVKPEVPRRQVLNVQLVKSAP